MRPLVELAFDETSPAAVERRVLQLMSPMSKSAADEFTVGNVLAAIQCLLPGESARPHRHTMAALRFLLEGSGAVTVVDGKACPMEYGDLILTPNWCWHEHHHNGTGPVLWLDVLDVPLHASLGTVKFQPGPMLVAPETMSDAAFSVPNIVPDEIPVRRDHSPVFRYPYADAAVAVSHVPQSRDKARRVRYVNPVDGGPAMELLDSLLVQVDEGLGTLPTRSSANALYAVVEGRGESTIGDKVVTWGPKDIFTAPQGNWVSHRCFSGPARLFMVTDREVLRRLNLYWEEVEESKN